MQFLVTKPFQSLNLSARIPMNWTRGQIIGRGSTATVSIAVTHGSGQVFAVKSAELHQSEFLKREQRILSTLKCPHIVEYKGCDITLENGTMFYNLFMEYAPYGTLADTIRKNNGGLDEATVQTFARQILLGLNHLHSNGIVHCDIKGRNVLIAHEGAKIADLGCARRIDSGGVIAGTPAFMAPEVARGEEQGFPADVWALGCTVLEMITGKAPWHNVSDPVSALHWIGFSGEVPEIPNHMTEQGKDFLRKCLMKDPNERWSVGELLKHGFVEESSRVLKEMGDLNSDTPTSVLDRSFWDSLETTQNASPTCPWDSAKDRIHGLCAEAATSFCGKPNWEWEWDENWITVRSNVAEGNEKAETTESDEVYVREDNSLIIFNEPETLIIVGFSSCKVNIDVSFYSSDSSCSNGETLLGCLSLCVKKNVAKGNFGFGNQGIFPTTCFRLSLYFRLKSTHFILLTF